MEKLSYAVLDELKNIDGRVLLMNSSLEEICDNIEALKEFDEDVENEGSIDLEVYFSFLNNGYTLKEVLDNKVQISYIDSCIPLDFYLGIKELRNDYTNQELITKLYEDKIIDYYNHYDCWDCMTNEDVGAYIIAGLYDMPWSDIPEYIQTAINIDSLGWDELQKKEKYYYTNSGIIAVEK